MKGIEIINASAGSGKTYSLTARVNDLLQNGLAPEGLMATTFTNKAAAELRERIRLELLSHNHQDEAQRIFDGFVGTVNSVCARLLTEYALDAGLSPALDVLPEEDGTRLFQIAIAEVIAMQAGRIEPAANRLDRKGGGSSFQPLADWRDDVRKIVDIARANQLDSTELQKCADRSWASLKDLFGAVSTKDLTDRLLARIQNAINDINQISAPKQDTQKALTALTSFSRTMKREGEVHWSDWIRLSTLRANKDADGMLEEVKDIAARVMEHPDFQEDVKQLIYGVFKCAGEALETYDTFKRKQGLMDFVDQETMVLDLARNNRAFQNSMQDRLQQMMVDEFQDTSPIQLALFLELHRLAGKSVWVGDPKQAIYSFRGTDPELMHEVTKQITATSTLNYSWRSCEGLVRFTNAIFTAVFHAMGKDNVCLDIPQQRKEAAQGGFIESWNLPAKNVREEAHGLAAGINDLLKRRPDIQPGDIAVLCRKNTQCTEIAEGLEALGIRASASQGALMETRECQLALAALRYMHDTKDTVALATIVHLSQLHSDNRSWLQSLVQDKERGLSQWKSDPLIEKLDLARSAQRHRTPMEALEYAISSADLVSTVRAWPEAASRLANLDLLRGVCAAYLDQCRARRGAATVAGFINYIQDLQQGEAEGTGRQTVQVLTYHKSKGLEWPIVILSALDSKSRSGAFGIEVEPAAVFDPANPLADRSVRFWPWPFGSLKNVEELQERLQTRQEEITTIERAAKESHRLIYVGMTRAREGLIFAQRKKILKNEISLKTAWLDELTDLNGRPLLELPVQSGSHTLDIAGTKIPVKVYEYMEAVQNNSNKIPAEEHYLPQMPTVITVYPPARISPSGLTLEQSGLKEITVQEITRLGDPVIIKGSPDPASLGNALHGFFGIETDALSGPELSETARAIINCWEITEALSAQDMLTVGERLHTFINKNYPGARVLREWPVTLHNTAHQRMHGWIDMLLELPEGYIVIDHKSYSGNDPKEHARQFAPQLAVYKEAIEKATGKEVISTLLHLPILGRIFKMTFSLNM